MFKLLNPSNTFFFINIIIKHFTSLLIIILPIGLIYSLWLSPVDYLQGDAVRIMYVHVPSAWLSLSCYAFIGLLSIISFLFKNKNFYLINKSLAPLGLMFTIIAIVTGSLWGQPTWGTWWAWDARLTSMLVLAFFYFFIILTYKLISNFELSNKLASLVAIIGLINLPLIKFSVDWWPTLHQPASINITSSTTIHASMLLPLLLMFVALSIYSVLIFLMKYKTEIIKIKTKGLDRL